ncbi:hypothetical protein D3C78_18670 [compost metagenome]
MITETVIRISNGVATVHSNDPEYKKRLKKANAEIIEENAATGYIKFQASEKLVMFKTL